MNKIKNTCNSSILINLPNARIRFELRPKQERVLAEDVMNEFNYDPGCVNLVKWGFIKVIYDEATKQVLDEIVVDNKTAADVDVKNLLTNQTPKDLMDVLKEASPALKDEIVNTAVELSIADAGRCNIIERYTGAKVLEILAMARKE